MKHLGLFDRILVGVDETEHGTAALVQALALAPESAEVRAVTAIDLTGVAQTGWEAKRLASLLEEQAAQARDHAAELLRDRPGSAAVLAQGHSQAVLRHEIDSFGPTLVALGGRRRSRLLGALLGETASMLVHDAAQSMLLARPPRGEPWTPGHIVVGIDGSPTSLVALAVAHELRDRLGSDVTVVAATGGKGLAQPGAWQQEVQEEDARPPVDALCRRSEHADLVIVGARGVHGVRALGSVSERVAHAAQSSVLVVHA